MVIPVEEHNLILENVLGLLQTAAGEPMDKIKVIISGAFCEQPPIGLIRTIEMAGCYIVDDDLLLGSRWIIGDIDDRTDNPLNALSEAYLKYSTFSSSIYSPDNSKAEKLISLARKRNADGIIFAAPSRCCR